MAFVVSPQGYHNRTDAVSQETSANNTSFLVTDRKSTTNGSMAAASAPLDPAPTPLPSSPTSHITVYIIGSGPGGCCVALELLKRGIRVRLYEAGERVA